MCVSVYVCEHVYECLCVCVYSTYHADFKIKQTYKGLQASKAMSKQEKINWKVFKVVYCQYKNETQMNGARESSDTKIHSSLKKIALVNGGGKYLLNQYAELMEYPYEEQDTDFYTLDKMHRSMPTGCTCIVSPTVQ